MNITIYKMEMRRNFRSFLIWTVSICSILFFGMLFYPVINAGGLLTQIEPLFENPMMKGLLATFGADVSSLGSLTGFYVTYNSMYNVLLGSIFTSVLAGKLFAAEESDKTAEFLYTKPIRRGTIFVSKTAVLLTYVTLLCLTYFLTSTLAMEAVKTDSPRLTLISERNKTLILHQIEEHPEAIYTAFNLTDESFAHYSLTYASDLLAGNYSEVESMNLDVDDMNRLIEEAMEGPEAFFEEVLTNPEAYMSLFSIPAEERETFLENVRGELDEYHTMKEEFFQSPELFLMFFKADPAAALDQFRFEPGSMTDAIKLLELPEDMEERAFRKYSTGNLLVLCTYIYLLILSIGSLVLLMSLLVKRGNSVLGTALGLVFFFYFLNSISNMAASLSPLAKAVGYISPFTWMDTNFSVPGFGLTWWRVLLFLITSVLSLVMALKIFKRKDILL